MSSFPFKTSEARSLPALAGVTSSEGCGMTAFQPGKDNHRLSIVPISAVRGAVTTAFLARPKTSASALMSRAQSALPEYRRLVGSSVVVCFCEFETAFDPLE